MVGTQWARHRQRLLASARCAVAFPRCPRGHWSGEPVLRSSRMAPGSASACGQDDGANVARRRRAAAQSSRGSSRPAGSDPMRGADDPGRVTTPPLPVSQFRLAATIRCGDGIGSSPTVPSPGALAEASAARSLVLPTRRSTPESIQCGHLALDAGASDSRATPTARARLSDGGPERGNWTSPPPRTDGDDWRMVVLRGGRLGGACQPRPSAG